MATVLTQILVGITLCAVIWGLANLLSILAGAQLVSTPRSIYFAIGKLAKLKSTERFIELGSGLGHVAAFVATHSQAQARGIDRVWFWVALARLIHRRSRATYQVGSVYAADLRFVDAVYCYLLPPMLARLEPKFSTELRPGSRVISYGFPLLSRRPNRVIERTREHGPLYLYQY